VAEQEELRLTVTVDDQATAQLQGLRGQLSSMSSGPQAAGLERLRRQGVEVSGSMAGLSEAMRGMATRAGIVGGVVGAVAGKLVELGIQFVQRATDLKGYSDALLALNKNAQLAGTSAAQFEQNMNTIKTATGGTAEEAAAGLVKFGEAWVDLQRQNSQMRQSLTRGLTGQDLASMQGMLTTMARSDVNTAWNIAQDYAQRIKQYWIDRGQEARGVQVSTEFLARFGMRPTEARLTPTDPAREQLLKDRSKDSETFRKNSEEASSAWARIGTSAAAILLSVVPINQNMKGVAEEVGTAATKFEEFEASLRRAGGLMNWLKQNAPSWLGGEAPPPPDTRTQRQRDQDAAAERFRKEEADKAAAAAAAAGARTSGARPPSAPVTRTGPPPSRFAPRVGPTPPPGIEPAPPEPPAPDQAAIDAAEAERAEARRQRELARRRAAAGVLPPALERPATSPPPAAGGLIPRGATSAPVTRPPGFSESRMAPPAVPAAPAAVPQQFVGAQISTTPPPPGVVTQPRPAEVPPPRPAEAPPAAEPRAGGIPSIADLLKPVAGAAPPPAGDFAGTGWRGLPLSRNVVTAPPAPPPPPSVVVNPAAAAAPSIVLPPAPPPIIVPLGGWPQPRGPTPAWPSSAEPTRARELGPKTDDTRPPSPSALEGGATSLMGGRAMDQAAAAQSMLDARALDRAAAGAQRVEVNGSGKISVDVRAPAGTAVSAQAGGLFKRTEIVRQTQMLPAEAAPPAATGTNAGQ